MLRKELPKPNLVLVHSFPTNSILLKGLIDYANEFFNVYFIDLPGFIHTKKPLKIHTLDSYTEYLEKQIKKLKLGKYLIGGVSFGFLVANNIKDDANCTGVVALEPFIGRKYLYKSSAKRFFIILLLKIICYLRLEQVAWIYMKFKILSSTRETFRTSIRPSGDIGLITIKEMNPKMFFNVARFLLATDYQIKFKNVPYILAINMDDGTIMAREIVKFFKSNKKELFILKNTVEHYPNDLSKKYFEKHMKPADVRKAVKWLSRYNAG